MLAAAITMFLGAEASAVNVTWTGATSSAWSVGSNWASGSAPSSGDSLFFNVNAASLVSVNDIGSSFSATLVNISGTRAFDIDFNGATVISGMISSNLGAPAANAIRNQVINGPTQQSTNAAGYQTVFQGVSGTGATFKAGNGTLIWTGSNSYSGPISLNVGTYLNNSSLASTITQSSVTTTLGGSGTFGSIASTSGTIQPGASIASIGVLSAAAGISLGGTTSVVLQVTGTGRGVGYDALIAGAALDYGNAIVRLDSLPGTAFPNGSTFQLFDAASFQNTIASIVALTTYAGQSLTFSGPGGGGEWTTGTLGNGQTLTFTPQSGQLVVVPEPSTCAMTIAGVALGCAWWLRQQTARSGAARDRR